jgi:hypothetical protein
MPFSDGKIEEAQSGSVIYEVLIMLFLALIRVKFRPSCLLGKRCTT